MTKNNFCQLWLTCKGEKEASKVANTLLVKHLVACAKQIPVTADYRWQGGAQYKSAEPSVAFLTSEASAKGVAKVGKIEHSNEVLLVMESREDLFDQVEREVAKLHSYDTFVLEALPISKISKKAEAWLKSELKNGKL